MTHKITGLLRLPDADTLRRQAWLQKFGPALLHPWLWRLGSRSAQRACAIGLFCAWLPLPIQMMLATGLAVRFQAHLPLTLALVWLNNPLTLPLLIYAGYQTGVWLTRQSAVEMNFALSWQTLTQSLLEIGLPLLLGSVVLGLCSALASWLLLRRLWWYRLSAKRRSRS